MGKEEKKEQPKVENKSISAGKRTDSFRVRTDKIIKFNKVLYEFHTGQKDVYATNQYPKELIEKLEKQVIGDKSLIDYQ